LTDEALGHGAKEGDEDDVVLLVPAKESRVGNLAGGDTFTLGEGRRWGD
jgi:hypothetical protein